MALKFRFSLKTFLVGAAAFALAGGILWKKHERQRSAVRAILSSGGEVLYDYQWPEPRNYLTNAGMTPDARPNAPEWLVDSLGGDYFGNVIYVVFTRDATDDDMTAISRLPSVEAVFVGYSKVTDDGLARLKRNKRLRYVWAYHSDITSSGSLDLMRHNPACTVVWQEPLIE